jgi:hypothetical protein
MVDLLHSSSFGFESNTEKGKKSGIKNCFYSNYDSKGLKPPHYDKEDWKVYAWQCFLYLTLHCQVAFLRELIGQWVLKTNET